MTSPAKPLATHEIAQDLADEEDGFEIALAAPAYDPTGVAMRS